MRHIHPFPARMAPEIALTKINSLSAGDTVLDPMSGSGMVLAQAAKKGIRSIGYDLDPLANIISRTGATKVDGDVARTSLDQLLQISRQDLAKDTFPHLEWIDGDEETSKFVKFWFGIKQEQQLRILSYYLIAEPLFSSSQICDLLTVAISRLIVSKEPKASLARDTAHSRPHRTIQDNQFDVFSALPKSLDHVLSALKSDEISCDAVIHNGDARKLKLIHDSSIDAVITSPPYLNAIDYMRGHRLSLVWWGYSLAELRRIRSISIGAERTVDVEPDESFANLADQLNFADVTRKNYRMLWRYFSDLCAQMQESARVLKTNGSALYVMGNSNIKGTYIKNSELLKKAAAFAGLEVVAEEVREIPNNRRYMPVSVHSNNALAGRMRTEHVIEFLKA